MVIVAQLVEPRIVVPAVVGSSPIGHPRLAITKTRLSIYGIVTEGHEGPLAQLVEQLTLNQRVVGSIPTRPTIKTITYSVIKNGDLPMKANSPNEGIRLR